MDEEQKEEKDIRRTELKKQLKTEIKTEIRDEIKTKDEKLDNIYKLLQKMDKVISAPNTTGPQRPKTSAR